jgi:hypothetical protein
MCCAAYVLRCICAAPQRPLLKQIAFDRYSMSRMPPKSLFAIRKSRAGEPRHALVGLRSATTFEV